MEKIKMIEAQYSKKDLPKFNVGDMVKVMIKIAEADKVRLHPFEGIVIAKKGTGINSSFTVRKVSYGEGIERVFLVCSPIIEKIEVVRKGKTKRAKLYYIRKKIGKEAMEISPTDIAAKDDKPSKISPSAYSL